MPIFHIVLLTQQAANKHAASVKKFRNARVGCFFEQYGISMLVL